MSSQGIRKFEDKLDREAVSIDTWYEETLKTRPARWAKLDPIQQGKARQLEDALFGRITAAQAQLNALAAGTGVRFHILMRAHNDFFLRIESGEKISTVHGCVVDYNGSTSIIVNGVDMRDDSPY